MNLFLDIGFTLAGGPLPSPPKRVIEILRLPPDARGKAYDVLFTNDIRSVEMLVRTLEDAFERTVTVVEAEQLRSLWQEQEHGAYALEGAHEFIAMVASLGYNMHLVSNIWYPYYRSVENLFSAEMALFSSKTLSFQVNSRKPSKLFYELALMRAGANPETVLMLGDSLGNDIEPCLQYGMKCLWYRSRPTTGNVTPSWVDEQLHRSMWVINTLEEASGVLKEIGHNAQ